MTVPPHSPPGSAGPPATYVYAVCGPDRPAHPGPGPGHPGGGPLRFLAFGSLRAVVQDVPADAFSESALRDRLSDPAELERCARTHHEIVTAATAGGPTVPLPLATLYLGDERAADALRENHERFRDALARTAGRAEWAVKVYLTQPAAGTDRTGPAGTPPAGTGPGDARRPGDGRETGRAYLNRLRGVRQQRELRQDNALAAAEQVDSAVRELAVGAVRRRPHGPEATGQGRTQVMNAAYLIAEEHSDRLASTVGTLRGHPALDGIEIEISGPWAPYSFTDGGVHAGQP
ncbi:GvpL/GvpF family gas vesicle protein [Streptomyces sp. NBC_00388]|uniref:GvpL/GvpF family gas vesicle protein n=1 Tax=Streptomyces sp. NBC_00388 TaxID=2975735 RepID=UPI002E1CE9C3